MRDWTARRLVSHSDSVFDEMNALAKAHGAINLGSGTPDLPVPDVVQVAAAEAMARGHNQYSPVRGDAVLREAVAAHAARFYGQQINPAAEVSITSGVTEALHAAILSFINPGDEVIVFEPCYDCYVPTIRMAGGVPVAITLRGPDFAVDPAELRAAFSPRSRAILLNTPHNPTGKVFTPAELTAIAELCQEYDILAITDEVYEHFVYDSRAHVRLATLPGMWERTLTLSGAGKTFSCTGWRIGWAIGPARFHEALCRLRQFTVFAAATPLQCGIAAGLGLPDAYFANLATSYQARRDYLATVLDATGLQVFSPEGSFFLLADISPIRSCGGRAFSLELTRDFGVAPVPTDTFYLHRERGESIVRFTFSVGREKLEAAAARLAQLQAPFEAVR